MSEDESVIYIEDDDDRLIRGLTDRQTEFIATTINYVVFEYAEQDVLDAIFDVFAMICDEATLEAIADVGRAQLLAATADDSN